MRALVLSLLIVLFGVAPASAGAPWRITKDHWSQEDEDGFGKFVAALGASNCSSTQSCLRDKSNPWRDSDEDFVDIDVDCAKWPYLLRGYYAWKNHLPMGYVDNVSGASGDLRYNKTPNRATSRTAILDHRGGIDAPRALRPSAPAHTSGAEAKAENFMFM